MARVFDFWLRRARVGTPGLPTETMVRVAQRWIAPVVRLAFRPTFEGVENLPTSGPYLLVANHSAGLGVAEIGAVIVSWLERFGVSRPLAGMAHVFFFGSFPMSRVLTALGAIPSTRAHTEAALRAGTPVLVFPGGDHETLRPIWQAHRVDFGGRKGFLRIARATGVPVVPMAIRGAHFTAPILFRVPRAVSALFILPAVTGGWRWSVSLLAVLAVAAVIAFGGALGVPLQIALSWALLGSPLMMLPWIPATIRIRIGAPMEAPDLFRGGDDDGELAAAYDRVIGEMQSLVDAQGATRAREPSAAGRSPR